MKVILKTREDSATGETGLVIEGVRDLDMPMVATVPGAGLQIAHDLVEHVNGVGEIGGIGDELEALGAMWFVRGVTGQLRRDGAGSRHSVEVNIASDVSRMAIDFANGVGFERVVPRTRASSEDDTFREILEIARGDAILEVEHISSDENLEYLFQYFNNATHFMRAGYRKARKKYGSTEVANNMFWQIAEAVDRCMRIEELLGQDFELSYTQRSAECKSLEVGDGY